MTPKWINIWPNSVLEKKFAWPLMFEMTNDYNRTLVSLLLLKTGGNVKYAVLIILTESKIQNSSIDAPMNLHGHNLYYRWNLT